MTLRNVHVAVSTSSEFLSLTRAQWLVAPASLRGFQDKVAGVHMGGSELWLGSKVPSGAD